MGKIIYLFKKEGEIMDIESMEKEASKVLSEYAFDEFPIDPVKIALKVGIPVRDVQFKSIANDNICGGIRKENTVIQIYVNKYDPINRKRFTIAHELGHYFLNHLSDKGEFVDLHRDINNSKKEEEIQANAFAAALLMNRELVQSSYKILKKAGFNRNNILTQLAELFAVSVAAMNLRLTVLGLR